MAATNQIRLLVVEDVPQVAQYIREPAELAAAIKLLDVMSDGSKVAARSPSSAPTSSSSMRSSRVGSRAPTLVGQLHAARVGVPVIVLTVPQKPVEADPEHGIHAVLSMPFSGYDLISRIQRCPGDVPGDPGGEQLAQLITVFAPKGGVGTTTIAFNLAVAFGQAGRRTVLIDGSLQFGDLRPLLKVPRGRAVDRSTCRPTGSPRRTWRTSCGGTRRASTSCSPRRASRWPRWSPSATSTRSCRSCAGSTRSS